MSCWSLTIDGRVGVAVPVAVEGVVGKLVVVSQEEASLAGLTQVHICEDTVIRVEQAVRGALLKIVA